MTSAFPFLSEYDPPGTSEGTIDPLGLYQIADQLAVQLVPAVRERMQRIRFLTMMSVGALVTEGLEDDPTHRDASPYLVWEWLVIEALVRQATDERHIAGVAGRNMAKVALRQHGYLDARSYLKTPRILGTHGIYKRLAVHLGLLNVHLAAGPNAERLVDAWARDLGLGGINGWKSQRERWRAAVEKSLRNEPPRTKQPDGNEGWKTLAEAFAPGECKGRERRALESLLHSTDARALGALPAIWELQREFDDDAFREEGLHVRLARKRPDYQPLLEAIVSYEDFARSLQDAFDLVLTESAAHDGQAFAVTDLRKDKDFKASVEGLHEKFAAAFRALAEVRLVGSSPHHLFRERFERFAEPMDPAACARALCEHHVEIQRRKSAEGKRSWFDSLGPDRIYVRHAYRKPRRESLPGRYVHEYRGYPIRRFRDDLS
jgi:hypothetical protein